MISTRLVLRAMIAGMVACRSLSVVVMAVLGVAVGGVGKSGENLAVVAKVSTSSVSGHEVLEAVNDGVVPGSSRDHEHGAYGNWPAKGRQWVEYSWPVGVSANAVEVYWWDDGRGVRLPASARVLGWVEGAWKELGVVGVKGDQFNKVEFPAVVMEKVRLEMEGAGQSSTGVIEWRVLDSGESPALPPVVMAGEDRVVLVGAKTYLRGAFRSVGEVKGRWEKVSGPGEVVFEDSGKLETSAVFSVPGEYVLKLVGGEGEMSRSGTVRVKVEGVQKTAGWASLELTRYSLTSSFFGPRVKSQIVNWIPHCVAKCEEADLKEGGLNNLIEAGKKLRGEAAKPHVEYPFSNAWVLNTAEAMCVGLMLDAEGDKEILAAQEGFRKKLEEWIPVILGAQEPDGYFQTRYTLGTRREQASGVKPERWSARLRGEHEGYVAGYFVEMGIAHYLATEGKDRRLLDAAIKLADCWDRNIGPEEGKKKWWDGHQAMEMALFRLAALVDKIEGAGKGEKYARLSRFLLDCRGKEGKGGEYDQAHVPVTEQYVAVGHAVRAVYLYAPMAEATRLSGGDVQYWSATASLWDNLVNRKMYLTGGVGSGETSEGFGKDYSLPNAAYCESCAGAGMIFFQHQFNLLTGSAGPVNVMEDALYNAVLSDIDLEGQNFTYTNELDTNHARYKWHVCPCCVGNIPRTVIGLPRWMYSTAPDGVVVNLFVGSEMQVGDVRVKQTTNYPWDGKVKIEVSPKEEKEWALRVRVPDRGVSELYSETPVVEGLREVRVNGEKVEARVEGGYAVIKRVWKAGDRLEFEVPMEVQRVKTVEQVVGNRGRVALRYGPLVYNFEGVDQKLDGELLKDEPLKVVWRPELLGGVMAIEGKWADGSPLLAIPNYARNNRGGRSIVWVKER